MDKCEQNRQNILYTLMRDYQGKAQLTLEEANPYTIVGFFLFLAYRITMLVFLCEDSQPDLNKYGESPKYVFQ